MIRRLFALILFLPVVTCVHAKEKETITVTEVSSDADAANGGIIYALPQTVVRITVKAQVVVETAGPYFRYSNKFLNLSNVITEDDVSWRLLGASISTYGKADHTRRYKVSASQPASLPSLSLTESGVLAAVNASVECKPRSAPMSFAPNLSHHSFDAVRLSSSVLTRTSTAAMAEAAANAIYALRERRLALLGGEDATVLHDAGSYNRVFDEIERLEREHVELFAGRRDTFIVEKVYDVLPDYDGDDSVVLLRFSEKSGFLDPLDLNGKPVYVDFEFNDHQHVNSYAEGSKQRKSAPLDGLRYIIPGNLTLRVLDRNNLLCEQDLLCTQNGQVATLPAAMLATKSIVLDTTNGAIKSISDK